MEWIERFGIALRLFHVNVCSKYTTKELEYEGQKRVRREAATRTGTEQGSSKDHSPGRYRKGVQNGATKATFPR